MVFKGLIAAGASLALMATPALAAEASATVGTMEVAPAGESVSGQQIAGGNWFIIAVAVVAVGLGLWAILDNGHHHDRPVSP